MIVNHKEFNKISNTLASKLASAHSSEPLNGRQVSQILSQSMFGGKSHAAAIAELKAAPKTPEGVLVKAEGQNIEVKLRNGLENLKYGIYQFFNHEEKEIELIVGLYEALRNTDFMAYDWQSIEIKEFVTSLFHEMKATCDSKAKTMTFNAIGTEDLTSGGQGIENVTPSFKLEFGGFVLHVEELMVCNELDFGRYVDTISSSDTGNAEFVINGSYVETWLERIEEKAPEQVKSDYYKFKELLVHLVNYLATVSRDVNVEQLQIRPETMRLLIEDLC